MNRPAFVFQRRALRNPRGEHPVTAPETASHLFLLLNHFLRVMGGSRWFRQILRAGASPKAAADSDLSFSSP